MTKAKARAAPLPLSVRLCSDKASFEALVLRKVVFDMGDARRRLGKASDYKLIVYTPHLLVFRCMEAEVTLSKDGRMLVKRVEDENEAKLVADRVWRTILRSEG